MATLLHEQRFTDAVGDACVANLFHEKARFCWVFRKDRDAGGPAAGVGTSGWARKYRDAATTYCAGLARFGITVTLADIDASHAARSADHGHGEPR